jgi:TRIAD3 protein (E3 ubiquitin-protein ligase RNF216)
MPEVDEGGIEFQLEKNWILAHVAGMRVRRDAEIAKKLSDEAEWAAGGGIECGCCFGDYLPVSPFTCIGLIVLG